MTVQTEFHDWQAFGIPDPDRCSPLLIHLMDWLLDTWGGMDIGCYGERPVQGGTRLSTHAYGAAADWRFRDPGIGRARMLAEVMPILLNFSKEIGVQAVHDYSFIPGGRVWRPPGTIWRPPGGVEAGWKNQEGHGSGMGETWATWLHIEIHPTRWGEMRSIPDLLELEPPKPPPPCVFDPRKAQFCSFPRKTKGTWHEGDVDEEIGYWQGVHKFRVANFAHFYGTIAHNRFLAGGTERHPPAWYARLAQRLFRARDLCKGLSIDKHFGPQTSACNEAVKRAFRGRKLEGRLIDYGSLDGEVIGRHVWWVTDHLADGRW